METRPPATPDPNDHQGPSAYEGWDPTPDPVGELDLPAADGSGVETGHPATAPGIAYDPDAPATVPATIPDAPASGVATVSADAEEVAAMRERLAFYESFDGLIRDNIDRAGALLREAATRQVDAEVKLRSTTKEHEAQRTEERTGYRKVFATLLDDVSTLQQQVERVARQVADALDDLEVQLPAVGELSAMERGQAFGLSSLASSSPTGHPEPAELPSGASSAAWVTHDGDLQGAGATPTTAPDGSTGGSTIPEPTEPEPTDDPIASDDLEIVEDAAGDGLDADPGAVDPEIVEDVLTEFTDADPAVSGDAVAGEADEVDGLTAAGELPPDTTGLAELSDLPEEFGLSEPLAGGEPGVVDAPYVEQSETGDGPAEERDRLDDHLGASATSEGYYIDSATAMDEAVAEVLEDLVVELTPLRQSAPIDVTETDGGLDELPGEGAADASDPSRPVVAGIAEARAPYGDQGASESGVGTAPEPPTAPVPASPSVPGSTPTGLGDPPSKLRRFETAQPRTPAWGTTPPAPRFDAARPAPEAAPVADGGGAELDTIVLVHGVPRATTALSLKRYLEGLAAVTTVEPREYAEGVLRLQVTGERPIRIADLSAWPDGSGLQEVTVRDDLVEIRLPG